MCVSLMKEMNRLTSKIVSSIYLRVTIKKSGRPQSFDFLSLENKFPGQFLVSSNSRRYRWNLKLLLQLKNQSSASKTMCSFSIILILKGILPKFTSSVEKRNRKWKISPTLLERWTLCFSSNNNHELKVTMWWGGAREKKRPFFVLFTLSEENFCNICSLS